MIEALFVAFLIGVGAGLIVIVLIAVGAIKKTIKKK